MPGNISVMTMYCSLYENQFKTWKRASLYLQYFRKGFGRPEEVEDTAYRL